MEGITVKSLDFSYGSVPILRNVNFTVPAGSFTVLLGQNGAGKSTLLKLILGELPLKGESGSIELLGQDIRQFKDWWKLSYVSQSGLASYQNFPASVEEIVQANLYAQIGRFRFAGKKEKEQVRLALAQVGMEDFAKRLISRLSGGQQQRVLLARALVNQPELLIMDEPTASIDEKSTGDFSRMLKRINQERGVTILMVTHDCRHIEGCADTIRLLEDGRMKQIKTDREEEQDGDVPVRVHAAGIHRRHSAGGGDSVYRNCDCM